jgi:predicted lipoprotein
MKVALDVRSSLGKRGRFLGVAGASLVATSVFVACGASSGPNEPPAPGDPALRAEILRNLGEEFILVRLQEFEATAKELLDDVSAYEETGDDGAREVAQQSFQTAMRLWQNIEEMQLGPLATQVRGGDELRVQIYSWPTTNTCRIDQILVDNDFSKSSLEQTEVNSRGLDALEYLLFTDNPENTCSDLVDINADGTWAALETDDLQARRRGYAKSAASLVADLAVVTLETYSMDDGFVSELVSAGSGSTVYSSSQDAFNDWATALFYLDTETKDMKLAQPAGIMDCPGTECLVESPFSGDSLDHIVTNLRSFDLQFFGGTRPDDGAGLDDLLIDIGHAEVAHELADKIDLAYEALAQIEAPLSSAVNNDDQDAIIQAGFDALKAVTDLFKTQIMSLLSLSLDSDMASDTD